VFTVRTTPNLARLVLSRQPAIIADTHADPDWRPVAATAHLRAWAGAPLVAQGEVVGFFSLDKREPGFYGPEHATRLSAFAAQAALAIQNARLFAEQQRRAEEQRLLLLAAHDLSSGLSDDAVLRAAVRHVTQALAADGSTVSLWDRAADQVVTLLDFASERKEPLDAPGTAYSLGDFPLTRRVLEERLAVSIDAAAPDADPAEAAFMRANGHRYALLLPLFAAERVFGLLEARRGPGRLPYTASDLQLGQNLAAQAGVALENARLHTAVRENLRELDALLTASEALLSTLELEPLLQNILAAAIAAIPSAEKGTVILAMPPTRSRACGPSGCRRCAS
jgi:GAF domain-containing protein